MDHEKQAGAITLAGVIEIVNLSTVTTMIVKYTIEISETRGMRGEDWMHCFGKNFYEVGL